MNRGVQLAFAVLALVLLVTTMALRVGSCMESRSLAGRSLLDPEQAEGVAPELSARDLSGRSVTLASFAGHTVLVNFWATWCAPCREELPHLASLALKLRHRPFVLLLVSVDENWGVVENLAEKFESEGNDHVWELAGRLLRGDLDNVVLALDSSEQSARGFGTFKYPESYLVGPDGKLLLKFVGPKAWGHPRAAGYFLGLVPQVGSH